MKKIYVIDTWRHMKRNIITVFAIILIVSLGISTYLGMSFAKISMNRTGNYYYSKQKLHNFEISYNYGITEDDLGKISKIEGIDAVEGLYKTTGFLKIGGGNRLVTVQSVTKKVDVANVINGRLPEKQNEIAIEQVMAEEDHVTIGDEVEINCEDENGTSYLLEKKFKVVGIVEHPAYSCNYVYSRRGLSEKGNGNCQNYFLVSKDAFNSEKLDTCYQSALVWSDTLKKYNCFSEEYKKESDKIKQRIEKIEGEQSPARYNDVKKKAGEEIVKTNWNIYDRSANISYVMYSDNADGIGKLSFSFAFVYIVVAFMVCYSNIGRMITKQKLLIGTQKALGFRAGEIELQYLSYACFCTFWGCVWGVLSAVFFIEKLSLKSYIPMYYLKNYFIVYDTKLIVITIISAFALTCIATLMACRKQIRKSTVVLLKDELVGDSKEFFFEKWFLWKKISLFRRTVIKNLLNEKRHMITTIIGVAGCTALMIIGFTLKFAISDVKVQQFQHIQKFDLSLQVESKTNGKSYTDELDKFQNLKYMSFLDKMVGVRLNGKDDIVADLLCADTRELNEYFQLKDEKMKKTIGNYGEGVLISANTAQYYHIKLNDKVDIMKENGEKVSVPVVGIVENYVCHIIIMKPDYYKKVMGEDAQNNIYFIKLNGTNEGKLRQAVCTKEGYIDLAGKEMGISIFKNIADSLNSVVEVMTSLSAIMALVVVLNLIIMYINEKSKMLAVMRINGYSIRKTKSFINFSNIILIISGLCIGVLVGILLGIQIVTIIDNDCVTFIHTPNYMACLLSCGISIGYSIIIGVIGNRKINNLELTNINRFE
ncbi:MAG: ABC transporter permease [Bacillota bacterium]|nr:ABC transporter permease [Bacillota bacterium]